MADPKFVKFNPEAQAAHDAWHQQMASIDAEDAILRARAAEIIKLKTDLDARRDKAHAAHTQSIVTAHPEIMPDGRVPVLEIKCDGIVVHATLHASPAEAVKVAQAIAEGKLYG